MVTHTIGGKSYTSEKYIGYLNNQYDAAAIVYNKTSAERNKLLELIEVDNIKLAEQIELLKWNNIYMIIMGVLSFTMIFTGGKFVEAGFKKWQHLQDMSDELAKLQLEKARKDVEGNESKIILPN